MSDQFDHTQVERDSRAIPGGHDPQGTRTGPDSEPAQHEAQSAGGFLETSTERSSMPVEQHRALLYKMNDTYHGGIDQRASVAHRLQRSMGNRYVQHVVARMPQESKGKAGEQELTQSEHADPNRAPATLEGLPNRGPIIQRSASGLVVQRDLGGSFLTKQGGFDVDLTTQQKVKTSAGDFASGMFGTIKFLPSKDTPYSNKIGLVQIVKMTDAGGADVAPGSLPAAAAPHLRTAQDPLRGVEKGFFTDIPHNTKSKGQDALPYYKIGPNDKFGFKRSDDPADMKAAELQDFPGDRSTTTAFTRNLDFKFETVAKGDDTLTVLGAVNWSFGVHAGTVVNEQLSIAEGESATFKEALEKHRDFYVHEPVTFYFDFNSDQPSAAETAKIDTFLGYLRRFPDVRLNLVGFADLRGNAAYNVGLAQRRAEAMCQALIRKGIDPGRINPPAALGATTEFTKDAKTPQDAEANRRGNRRVTLTFEHTQSIGP